MTRSLIFLTSYLQIQKIPVARMIMTAFPSKISEIPSNDSIPQIRARIRKLQTKASWGLWNLALFLLVSLAAFEDFLVLPDFPDSFLALLGKSPPPDLISIALVVYAFSAMILLLARMVGEYESKSVLKHVVFLSAFYGFYHFAGVLQENYWAVFASGVAILGLESVHFWLHYSELLRLEEERLVELERRKKEVGN